MNNKIQNSRDVVLAAEVAAGHEWRQIVFLPDGYLVSSGGKLVSPKRVIRGSLSGPYLSLNTHGKKYYFHRIVAITFLGPPPLALMHVNHKDGDKLNNRRDNLEWTTPKENCLHAVKVLFRATPMKEPVLTAEKISECRAAYRLGEKVAEISKKHNLKYHTIYKWLNGVFAEREP
jgi:hypothetical protein